MLLVGGGQEYYGPTSTRDKQVIEHIAKQLFNHLGNSIEIITGGMPGIPMDFVRAWKKQGGSRVKFIVSDEYLDTLTDIEIGIEYNSGGKTQAERRQALVKWPDLTAALFIQGGQYTTDEIIKCQEKGLPTICFVGSGGASGGIIPYKGNVPKMNTISDWMKNTDPDANAEELGRKFADTLKEYF